MHLFYTKDQNAQQLIIGNDDIGYLRFHGGWAEISEDDPHLPALRAAIAAQHMFNIEDLGPDTDRIDPEVPGAFICDICGKAFKTKLALRGHVRTHAPVRSE